MPDLILAFLKFSACPGYLKITFQTDHCFITYLMKQQKT
jgi:hypothetical protein